MTELLTATQMRAIEKAAIDGGEVTGLELMERAGAAVVEAIFEEWPQLGAGELPDGGSAPRPTAVPRDISEKMKRAVVLCGPGNNGGDGFVVARLLTERGWEVEVFLYGDAAKLPADAKVNYLRWCELGEVLPLDDTNSPQAWGCDLLLDALFGTGLRRALPDLGDLFWNMGDMVECFPVECSHSLGRLSHRIDRHPEWCLRGQWPSISACRLRVSCRSGDKPFDRHVSFKKAGTCVGGGAAALRDRGGQGHRTGAHFGDGRPIAPGLGRVARGQADRPICLLRGGCFLALSAKADQ